MNKLTITTKGIFYETINNFIKTTGTALVPVHSLGEVYYIKNGEVVGIAHLAYTQKPEYKLEPTFARTYA